MSSENIKGLRAFSSVCLIILTLLGIVFLQMEERRMGYSILKLTREHKKVLEQKRVKEIQLAKSTRPQLLEQMAQNHLTLKKIDSSQIIHMSLDIQEKN